MAKIPEILKDPAGRGRITFVYIGFEKTGSEANPKNAECGMQGDDVHSHHALLHR